jgi:hypothetical protein
MQGSSKNGHIICFYHSNNQCGQHHICFELQQSGTNHVYLNHASSRAKFTPECLPPGSTFEIIINERRLGVAAGLHIDRLVGIFPLSRQDYALNL